MLWRKTWKVNAFALGLLALAGPGFGQARIDQPAQPNPPAPISPSTPDGSANSSAQPSQSVQPGSASTLDQPVAPGAAGGANQADQTNRADQGNQPDTLTQPAQPTQGGDQAQGNWNELRGKIIDLRQIGVQGTQTPNTVVLLETNDGQQVAIDLGPEGVMSGASLRKGDEATIRGAMISVKGNPVFIARELDMGGKTWQVTRPKSDRFTQMGWGTNQLTGTVQYFEDVDLRGGGGKNRVALIQTDDGRRMLVDLGPVSGLQSMQLNKGDQLSVTGHNAWVSGERSVFFADQVRAGGQTLDINRPPFSPGSPESTGPAGQSSQQPSTSSEQGGQTPGGSSSTQGGTTSSPGNPPPSTQPQSSQPPSGQAPPVPGTINFQPGMANPPLDHPENRGEPATPGSADNANER